MTLHGYTAGLAELVDNSAPRALAFTKAMQATRTVWPSSRVVPSDPTFAYTSSGGWSGSWTMPDSTINATLPDTPVLLLGPLWFPIAAHQPVTFAGTINLPFASLEGDAGIRYIGGNPANGVDPATAYNQNGTVLNWGTYYVIGSCNGVTQFRARIGSNYTWAATVNDPPSAAGWSFQLATYSNQADDTADANRRLIGNPWNQSDRPGDTRAYWNQHYATPPMPLFINVSNVTASDGSSTTLSGDINPAVYTAAPGTHCQVMLTEEVDVEYVQALLPVTNNHFSIVHNLLIKGRIKLRLVELSDTTGAPIRQITPIWDQDNFADPNAFPDLRVEYYEITNAIPGFPTYALPARQDHAWSFAHTPGAIGRVRLIDINTKRILGEFTMPSGLARSYIVPAAQAGQSTNSVYYDGFLDTCFLYDQAVALIALIQQHEWDAAQQLIDALMQVQNDGGSFPFAASQFILSTNDYSLLRTGVIAWVAYALLLADLPQYRDHWRQRTTTAATDAVKWMVNNTLNSIGLFKGGIDASGVTPWWSTEHNLDAWWALDLADRLYGSATYNYRFYADGIKASLLTYGWDGANSIFWQGGGHTTDTQNDGAHALDMHTWGAVALEKWGRTTDRDAGIARAYSLYYVTDDTYHLSGFTTFIPQDGYPAGIVKSPWCEGTFGMVLALRNVDPKRAYGLIATMARGQLNDGSYRYTLQRDPIEPIETFPCLIGAAWNVIALSGAETPNQRVIWT